MIFLDATTKTLEIDLEGAVTTTQLPFVATYVDVSQATFVVSALAEQDGTTNSTTAVTILSAPGASTTRKLESLHVVNVDTVAAVVTIQYNNNGTLRTIFKVTLAVGDQISFLEAKGWAVIQSTGSIKAGTTGAAGATGATGSAGASGTGIPGQDGEDGEGWPGPPGTNAAAGNSGGWAFKSYTTATGTATVTVSSLDLNTDLAYQFVIETSEFAAAEGITARVNADATGDSAYTVSSEDTSAGAADAQATGVTQMVLHGAASCFAWAGRVNVCLVRDGRPSIGFLMHGARNTSGTGGVQHAVGSGLKNATTNLTSMQFLAINTNTANWKVWCFKASQS